MITYIPLEVLIIDPDQETGKRLKTALAAYRNKGKETFVHNLCLSTDLIEAQRTLEETDINCIFIDPVSIGLETCSEFIFKVRRVFPRIIFVLFCSSDHVEPLYAEFYRGERARFHHYFKLNKKSEGEKLERKLLQVIHLCMSDIRLQISLARAQVAELRKLGTPAPPVEISESLCSFKVAYSQKKTAFIMMSFERSDTHNTIASCIKTTLAKFDIIAMRADDREFHENLYDNILTYMHGCDFGVAVVERISNQSFNANISFEVGYMKALKKPVCILKDKTFQVLQADLLGKLYREFDTHCVATTVESALNSWIGNLLHRVKA